MFWWCLKRVSVAGAEFVILEGIWTSVLIDSRGSLRALDPSASVDHCELILHSPSPTVSLNRRLDGNMIRTLPDSFCELHLGSAL